MKFREHRGTLDDSMTTCVELADRDALIEHVTRLHDCFIHNYDFSKLIVEPYVIEHDERCGWKETWIVSLPGYGPIGFTDGPATRSLFEEISAGLAAILRGRRSRARERIAGQTVIGHPFEPGEPAHQCKLCGWPKQNHL